MTGSILERRRDAAQKTLDRYKGKPFAFGRRDCAQLVRFHLKALGCPLKVAAKAGSYHSLIGAKRALKRLGYDSLIELMDAHFPRIPPAAALVGDVMAIPGLEGPGALAVCMGNNRVCAYHEDAPGAVVGEPKEFVAAWGIL